MGGRPYAPIDQAASAVNNDEIVDLGRFNQERLPSFQSLYLRADRRFFFNRTNMVLYLEVWNAYNNVNVTRRFWNVTEQRVGEEEQFSLLPVLGAKFEF